MNGDFHLANPGVEHVFPPQVTKSLKVEDKRVTAAEKLLFTAAQKLGNPRLAALASRVRLDAFSKVR